MDAKFGNKIFCVGVDSLWSGEGSSSCLYQETKPDLIHIITSKFKH